MAETNTSNIGFEKQIWDAACVLRGNLDASEYKSVVLGLIFLKYISDRFEAKYQELVDEGDGFEEDKDEYTAENIFFVPENARWSVIAGAAHTPEIGTVIDEAMRAIEQENKRLKDILPKNFARQELDKRRLGDVVDLFTNIQMVEHGNSKDILGRTYEYCLSKFAEQEGKLAGEFYTPACVVKTLVEILQPYNGRVYDPCCGSGGMFVQSAKFVENHGGNINKISVFGQDSNPTTWKMAQMNLAIRGIEADLGKFSADTFFNDAHPQLKADFIMANPPFNLSNWGQDKLLDDVHGQRQFRLAPAHDLAPGSPWPHGHGAGQRLPVLPEWWGGGDPQKYHQRRSGGLHRGHALPVVLHHPDSRLPVVFGEKQEAEGEDSVHRRPEDGHHGYTQAAGTDRWKQRPGRQ